MKKKIDSKKHKKDATKDHRKIEEEQILMDDLKKELKKEILDEGLFILAIYIFFMDYDL